uniref:Nematode cuticle collagen N-terminal domain-containing protein n=1 Tax=Meloidogyne javanica TaxID=6303 RepID=A0A915MXF4_MELJA
MKDNLICFAITISVTTIIMCIAGIICLNIQLQSMWDELGLEIKQFNIKTDNIWEGMLSMGAGTPSNRQRRQIYGGYGVQQQQPQTHNLFTAKVATGPLKVSLGSSCNCISQNDCPAGPPGFPGVVGPPGERGIGGVPGIPGHDAMDVHSSISKGCFVSEIGKPGKAGDVGKDAEKLIGRKGVRGTAGPEGPPGQIGEKGLDGVQGKQGVKGPSGTPGSQGPPGPDGEEGGRGVLGKHGQDAEYW